MGRRGAPLIMPYVHTFKDRHGKRRHYYRRGTKRVPLPGLPGDADFMAAYARASEAVKAEKVAAKVPDEGTFKHLVTVYLGSLDFARLKPDTRRVYRGKLEKFAEDYGDRSVAMPREAVAKIVKSMMDTPGAAYSFLKRFRTLMRFAVVHGYAATDPTAGIKLPKIGEVHTWTDGEIAAFEARWPIGTRERLAFALHLYTGQRGSDVHRMAWKHIYGDRITVIQQKTGTRLEVPIDPALGAILATASRDHAAIVATEKGTAFSAAAYSNWINGAIHKAGLPPECTAHGLRKAAARQLAEGEATENEIMSVTGHKTHAEVSRYTKAANQRSLSASAVRKRAGKSGKPTVS